MKAAVQPNPSAFISLILKLSGLLLVLGVLVNGLVIAYPLNGTNSEWWVTSIAEWIERGNIALVGLAFMLFGIWVKQAQGHEPQTTSNAWLIGATVLSVLLGLLFLVIAPTYARGSQLANTAAVQQLEQAASAAEAQLDEQLAAQRSQVSAVLSNQELVDQLQQRLQSNDQLSEQEQTFLQGIQDILQDAENDPAALDKKVEEARQQGLQAIQTRQQQAIAELNTQSTASMVHVLLKSLLLAAGALFLAASAFRAMAKG
jgi:ABC-type multidrug transport system fused ATPase/permease subunit